MATDARGHTVPAGTDAFDPQGDIDTALTTVNDIVPVANSTGRASALAAVGATTTDPLLVSRTDTRVVEGSWGSGFYALTDRQLAVLKTGFPANKALAASSTVDLIASSDTGGIPSITPDPGGRVKLDLAFQFVTATSGSAGAATVSLLVDGAIVGTAWSVHTGIGADAAVLKQYTVTLEGWLTPGTSHTVNARLTSTGGVGINVQQINYTVRG